MKAIRRIGSLLLSLAFLTQSSNLRAQAPFSDTFTEASLNPAWTFENPNPDSSYAMTGTSLNIIASWDGGGSDLWSGSNLKAPRLLQPVDPSLDWIIETGFGFSPGHDYQGAGLLLARTNQLFSNDADFTRIAERAFYPNGGGNVIRSVGGYVLYSGASSCLRVQKSGTNYTGWWSSDGVQWTLNGTTTMTGGWPYFGLFVIRYMWDGAQINSSASFYYFNVTVTTQPTLSIQPLPPNQVVISWPSWAANYVLVSTNQIPTTTSWPAVAAVPTPIGNSLYVTNALGVGAQFFQLRQP